MEAGSIEFFAATEKVYAVALNMFSYLAGNPTAE